MSGVPSSAAKVRWAYVCTGLLAVTGAVAAAFLMGPICYVEGRMWLQDEPRVPVGWRAVDAPWHLIVFGLGAVWAGAWLLHVQRTRRLGLSWWHAVLPMAVFLTLGMRLGANGCTMM